MEFFNSLGRLSKLLVKNTNNGENIKILGTEERTLAIAQMLSGQNPSEAILASAREMMGSN